MCSFSLVWVYLFVLYIKSNHYISNDLTFLSNDFHLSLRMILLLVKVRVALLIRHQSNLGQPLWFSRWKGFFRKIVEKCSTFCKNDASFSCAVWYSLELTNRIFQKSLEANMNTFALGLSNAKHVNKSFSSLILTFLSS